MKVEVDIDDAYAARLQAKHGDDLAPWLKEVAESEIVIEDKRVASDAIKAGILKFPDVASAVADLARGNSEISEKLKLGKAKDEKVKKGA